MIKYIIILILLLSIPEEVNAQNGIKVNTELYAGLSFRNSNHGDFYTGIKPIDAIAIKRNGIDYLIAIFQDFDESSYRSDMVIAVYQWDKNSWKQILQRNGNYDYKYLEGTLELHFNGTQAFFETDYPVGGTYPYHTMYFILFDYLEDKVLSVEYGNYTNIDTGVDARPKSQNAFGLPRGGDIEVQYTYDGVTPEMLDFIKMKIKTSGNIIGPLVTQKDKDNAAKAHYSYYEQMYKEQDEKEKLSTKQKEMKSAAGGINIDDIKIGMSIKQVKDIINVAMKLDSKNNNSTVYKVFNFGKNNYDVYFLYFNSYGVLKEINTGESPADIEIEIKH